MQSVSTINSFKVFLLSLLITGSYCAQAQENSPFSRYGLGDLLPSQNIVNRAIGGLSSMYSSPQNVNFSNPASYYANYFVTYDVGVTFDSRTLQSTNPITKHNSRNLSPAYLSLALPLSFKKKIGLAFGLKPVTKISYNINESRRQGLDSILSLYEGTGGLNQAFIGIGKKWNNGLSLGFNTGYYFGNKSISTRTLLLDSLNTYKSNSATDLSYNSAFLNLGLQYVDSIGKKKNGAFKFGVSGNLKQKLNASRTVRRETYAYDINDVPYTIDSVYNSGEQSGSITLPQTYTAGISYSTFRRDNLNSAYEKSMIGVEYESSKWSQFRSFDEADRLIDSWQMKLGGQITPDALGRNYWSNVTYRAGFAFGKNAVNADGNTQPFYLLTLGAGFPLKKFRSYDNQFTVLNTTFEIGKRGNSKNNITESFFRFSVSVNLFDRWFIKRKYD